MNWSLVLAGKSQRNLRESWCVPLNFPPGNCFYHPTGECVLKNAGWSFFLQSNFQIYTAKMRNHCLCFYTWMIMPKVKVTRLLCSGGFPNFLQQGSLQQRHNSFVNLGEDFFTLEKRPGKGKGFFLNCRVSQQWPKLSAFPLSVSITVRMIHLDHLSRLEVKLKPRQSSTREPCHCLCWFVKLFGGVKWFSADVPNMGAFLKWWVSPTNPWVFLLNMSGDWGYHHLRKPSICPSL